MLARREVRDVAYVALGSNLGDREASLALGRAALGRLPDTRLLAATPVEETVPLGPVPQGPFLNQMVALDTGLPPEALLDALLNIERAAGRVRSVRWGPRSLDLDIVAFGRTTFRSARLIVPHPELPNREFWRRELAVLRSEHEQR